MQWTGKQAWLDACFVASLVTARLYLNMLGIAKKGNSLVAFEDKGDDVTVDDVGGKRVSISTISQADQGRCCSISILMADKAAAHFTTPKNHDRTTIPKVILMVHGYIKTHTCTTLRGGLGWKRWRRAVGRVGKLSQRIRFLFSALLSNEWAAFGGRYRSVQLRKSYQNDGAHAIFLCLRTIDK